MIFFSFLLILLFNFFSGSLINGVRSRECCNEAWHYEIHSVVCKTIILKSKSYFFSFFYYYLIKGLTVMSKTQMSAGQNIMCERTWTSLLVHSSSDLMLISFYHSRIGQIENKICDTIFCPFHLKTWIILICITNFIICRWKELFLSLLAYFLS